MNRTYGKPSVVLALAVAGLGAASHPARALEYPCPSDPGFCYLDFGNDGCFDSGIDEGPINDEIEASTDFPPVPYPGSIVCPPTVEELIATGTDIWLQTDPGSSILFYSARVIVGSDFATTSGGDLLLGGKIFGVRSCSHTAAGDIHLEDDVFLQPTRTSGADINMESLGGDVTVGPRVSALVNDAVFLAPAGDIVFLDRVVLRSKGSTTAGVAQIQASGVVDLTRLQIEVSDGQPTIDIRGSEVVLRGKSKIVTNGDSTGNGVTLLADSGDVTIERLALQTEAPILISGENVTIGVAANGKVPRSKIVQRNPNTTNNEVDILAEDTIQIENLALDSTGAVLIDSEGTTVAVRESVIRGKKHSPTVTIAGGTGSTCDLTGTEVLDATLTLDCDTVIGGP